MEGAGAVVDESLAAESIREGGGFAANRAAEPGSGPARDPRAGAPNTRGEPHKGEGALENQQSYAGTAPSYASSGEFMKDTKGPHGKNLTEGGFQGSGTDGGVLPEPGSQQDPARVAENSMMEGMREGSGQAKRRVGQLENEQPYGALATDEPA